MLKTNLKSFKTILIKFIRQTRINMQNANVYIKKINKIKNFLNIITFKFKFKLNKLNILIAKNI